MKYHTKQQSNNKGFVILFVVLISTTILLITASIFNVSLKGVVLSSYSGQSQLAFYNADSALECALHADIQDDLFDTIIAAVSENVVCTNQTFPTTVFDATPAYSHIHGFRYHDANAPGCAYVFVEKVRTPQGDGTDDIDVRVTGIGYNTCTDDTPAIPDFNDPTLLERRLSIEYTQSVPSI